MITPLVSFGHCIVCRSFYGVWLPIWYLLATVLSVCRFTVYDYLFGIFWPLYCLSVALPCLITPLVSFGHCFVCRSLYRVWLPLWYLLAIVLSVGRFTVYDYLFGIFWPLYCLSVVLRCMITSLVSFGHCIVCRSIYGVWLPLWYLLATVLSVGRFTVYDYPFGIFCPLYCLSVVLRCMITPLVSFGHCIVCRSFYGVWLLLWYLLANVLSVGHFMVYDYPFGMFWPLYCLSVVLRCMITPLVSFGHCIVCRRFTVYDYPFGIFWPLYCLSVVLRCMITSLVSFGHWIVCRSFYGVWLPLWYRLATVLSVGSFTVYGYPFGIFWPLYCLSVVLLWMITPLVSFGHCIVCRSFYGVWLPLWYLLAIVLSVCRFTVYDYPFGIFWPLYCLSVVLRCMITSLVSFGHCIVCLSFYGVWLPLWYRLATVLSVGRFTVYDYPFGIFWPLYCLSIVLRVWLPLWYRLAIVLSVGRFTVYDYPFGILRTLYCLSVALRCMITPLVPFGHCIMSVVLRCMITPVVSFGHCIVCRAFYGVWLPLWYRLATVLSVGRFTVYDYPFGIFWPLYYLSVLLWCIITSLVSFGHCIVCRSFYGAWLPLWYLLATVLSVGRFTVNDYPFGIFCPLYCVGRFTVYDYPFGIVWPLYCLSVVLRCMITPVVSFGHCIVCRSFYGAWLPLWYLLATVLSVGRFTVNDYPFGIFCPLYCVGRFTVYDYPFGIVWPLYCLSVVLRCMITPVVSFGHCIVCRSFYGVWLPLWYLLAIVLSVGRFTVYDYPFGIVWPLYCLSVVLRYMITHLVSFGHCIVCRSFYGVWLPLWYRLATVLSVGRFMVYDYPFGIFWPLYCLSVVLRYMITHLVSYGHCIVCRAFYGVLLPLWYLLAIVLSVGRFTVYDYPFGIFWPLYCLSVVLRWMITPLVSFAHCIVSVVLRCMITPLVSCGHCIVCSSFYGVWLPLWYLVTIVFCVGNFTVHDYPFGIFWPFYCVGRFTVYDYPFGIVWPLYCLSVVLRCMITPLVSCGHCVFCRLFYGVWLPLWYLLATVLSVGRFTVYDYPFGIFWPLYCLSVVLRCMITPLVWFGHCIVCRSFYGVWLQLWYLLAIVLSVCRFTVYDYPFGIFWPLYCLSVVLRCMITSLVSFGHCIVCRSFYGVWLPLWYGLATVLSVGRFTVYDYLFGIFWPLYCLSVALPCLITPLVSFGHCIVCRSFYGVWLPL